MNTTVRTLKLYWQHVWRYPHLVIGILIATPVSICVGSFLTPLIAARIINRLSMHDYITDNLWGSFGGDLLLFGVLMFSSSLIGWRIIDYFTWHLEGKVERDIAQRVFDHLIRLSPNFHANHFGGSLVSQTNKLMGSYIRFADTTIFQVIPLIASLLSAGIILWFRTPMFSVLLLVFSSIYLVSAVFITRRVRKRSAEQAAAESQQTGNLADAVTNVMAIKSFSSGDYERSRFARATENTHHHLVRMMQAHQDQQIYFSTLTNTIYMIALIMAIVSTMYFHANVASVFLILTYTMNIARSLFEYSNATLRNYNRSIGDAADMVEILHVQQEIKDPDKPEASRIQRGDITFKSVTFTHEDAGRSLFRKLNIHIKPGEKVGLIGHSGSGKTTFTRLLLRFNDIDSGEILIDGQNISRITQDDLRRSIAYVPQEPILFHRSLAENISYGSLKVSQREIEAAAKMAYAHNFINVLPNGYETLVGERGIKLSGGQRQRIAIARAMLKNAPILVLDEATSSLDSESEALIQQALWKLMEGRTTIVVAHRLSTIQKMDRIVVMEDGKIVEQGTHKELLKVGGTYADLWSRQSGGFIEG